VPKGGVDFAYGDAFPHDVNMDLIGGVDFRKGCYVGQEVTARMKHKTELRKGLTRVTIDGQAPVGTDVLAAGKVVGRLFTQSGTHALAHLRLDQAKGVMTAGSARITLD
jgi:folate-binding protein YgfZ